MALVGVAMDRGPDDAALAEMAWCFIQEFALMGWSSDRILRMFKSSAYRGPHAIYHRKGEEFVRGLLDRLDEARSAVHLHEETHL